MSPKENFDEPRDPRTRDGGHSDSVSETDSGSQLPPHQTYTPTSSSSNDKSAAGKGSPADEGDDDSLAAETEYERAPLLSDPPPQYEDALKHDGGGGSTKAGDVAPLEVADPGAPGNCRKGKCCRRGRKRFRKICLLVLLKIVLLVGAALCLSAAVHGWRAKHYTCTTEYEYEYEYDPSSPPPKRDIVLDRGSDSIWGRWPLYDTLSLTTTSGSIAVTIDPQPADPDDPDKPARLVLKTTSGSIAVSFSSPYAASIPENEMKMDLAELATVSGDQDQGVNKSKEKKRKHKTKQHICKNKPKNKRTYASGSSSSSSPFPPPRPYEIEIHTESGSISGRFLFSTYASLESRTGSISALLIPVFYPSSSSSSSSSNVTLTTRTSTGSQYVRLTEPFEVPASPPSGGQKKGHSPEYTARSSHVSSGSGSMRIAYPRVWAGEVHAAAHGGQIRLGGKGLQVREEESGGSAVGFKEPGYARDGISFADMWWGSRGDMNVSLVAEGSGSIDFFVQ
ncbi:hypothetical protein VTN00DRAFT_2264 [Thermoascus crustaceus]|uniref:uncharacterized protein n=1 Tax=Thermoascus crustaceus TaxID=5088 RepID=UPI0037442108